MPGRLRVGVGRSDDFASHPASHSPAAPPHRARQPRTPPIAGHHRQHHRENASTAEPRLRRERPAVGLHDPLRDRQPKAEAAALRRTRPNAVRAPEAIEDVRQIVRRDPHPGIAHDDRDLVVRTARHRHLHATAARRVLDRVRHEVEQQLAQARAIAHHDRVLERRHRERETRILAEDHRGLVDLAHQRLDLDRRAMDVEASLVGAREREQTVDEIRHARRFLQRLLERDHRVGAIGPGMHRALDIGTQHGERRLELVARVGGEPPQRGERRLEAREHRVHREAQARQLVVARVRGQPPMQASAVGDRLDLVDQLIHRPERIAHDEIRDDHRDDEDDRREHRPSCPRAAAAAGRRRPSGARR